jgi:hypothetical protein
VVVVRKADRASFPERPGDSTVAYRFESLDFPATERRFNSYLAEFLPIEPGEMKRHAHPGAEFLYVLQGTLTVHLDSEEYALDISIKTVEVHKANAMRKLGLRGRTDVVRYAALNGWLKEL